MLKIPQLVAYHKQNVLITSNFYGFHEGVISTLSITSADKKLIS